MVVDPGRYWQGKLLQEPMDDSRNNTEAGTRERKRDAEMKEHVRFVEKICESRLKIIIQLY